MEVKYGCECSGCRAHTGKYPADKEVKALRVRRTDGREIDICASCFHIGFDTVLASYITDTPEMREMLLKADNSSSRVEQVMAAVAKLSGNGEGYDKLIAGSIEMREFFDIIDKDNTEGGFAARMSIRVGVPWQQVKKIYNEYKANPTAFVQSALQRQDDPLDRLLNDILGSEPTKVSIH